MWGGERSIAPDSIELQTKNPLKPLARHIYGFAFSVFGRITHWWRLEEWHLSLSLIITQSLRFSESPSLRAICNCTAKSLCLDFSRHSPAGLVFKTKAQTKTHNKKSPSKQTTVKQSRWNVSGSCKLHSPNQENERRGDRCLFN